MGCYENVKSGEEHCSSNVVKSWKETELGSSEHAANACFIANPSVKPHGLRLEMSGVASRTQNKSAGSNSPGLAI